jgi:hypothetical protein
MKVKLLKATAMGLALGAFVLIFACAAQAATYMNLYGTSEEFNFWSNEGIKLLTTFGCSASTATRFYTSDSKSWVLVGSGCNSAVATDNGTNDQYIYLTYTNKASWDGIDAVNNFWDEYNWGTYDNSGNLITSGTYETALNPCGSNNNQRNVATCVNTGCSSGGATYSCQGIQIGVANLEAGSIVQVTNGTLQGPVDYQDYATSFAQTERAFTTFNNLPGVDTSNIATSITLHTYPSGSYSQPNPAAPLIYPFAFYVNTGVTSTRCNSSSPTTANIDNFCIDDSACGSTAGNHTYCTAQTIDNITRLQAVALFSGNIAYWSDFGGYFVKNLPVTLCLRHSGAGTLAAMDFGVMQGTNDASGWGGNFVTNESRWVNGNPPYAYFNDLASDETNCLKAAAGTAVSAKNAGGQTDTQEPVPAAAKAGAIGFVDADTVGSAGNYVQIRYNGVWPTRVTMRDGIYDNYWILDRLYAATATGIGLKTGQQMIYAEMLTLESQPTEINSTTVPSQYLYYGSPNELYFQKGNANVYPITYGVPSAPQTP